MIEILRGGLHTTVQDMGRRGGQSLGIPPSGDEGGKGAPLPALASPSFFQVGTTCIPLTLNEVEAVSGFESFFSSASGYPFVLLKIA